MKIQRIFDFNVILVVMALLIAVVPILIIFYYAITHGGENFSDDYWAYTAILADFLQDKLTISNLFKVHIGPHLIFFPTLIRMASVATGWWSPQIESGISIVIGILRMWVLWQIISFSFSNIKIRLLLLVAASMAVFSLTQLGMYVYGDTGIPMGLDNLGFALGLWGLIRFPRTWLGITIMLIGGFISTWSWGFGTAWCMFLLTMIVFRFRWFHYFVWLVGCSIAHWPIIQLLISQHTEKAIVSFFNPLFIIGALGRPLVANPDFIDNYPLSNYIGIGGVIIFLSISGYIAFLRKKNNSILDRITPSLILALYAIACIYQVSLGRTGIGSWYTTLSMHLWLGLVGMLAIMIAFTLTHKKKLLTVIFILQIFAIIILYLKANHSFEHKTFFLSSRNLSAASCVRTYKNAPTYCDMLVFNWQPTYQLGNFGKFFDKTQLSVFSPIEVWTLQGDFALDNVYVSPSDSIIWFSGDTPVHRLSPLTADRLNIAIPAGAAVSWTITLPPATKVANLAGIVQRYGKNASQKMIISMVDENNRILHIDKIQEGKMLIPIIPLKESKMKIVFSVQGSGEGGFYINYPRIQLVKNRNIQHNAAVTDESLRTLWVPSNVDSFSRLPDKGDMIFKGKTLIAWEDLPESSFKPVNTLEPLSAFNHFVITIRLPQEITKRMLHITLMSQDNKGQKKKQEFNLSFLASPGMHTYSFPLHILAFTPESFVSEIQINSPWGKGMPEEQKTVIEIAGMRLSKK